ncbi:MAG: glycosyltransferase [Verrucomicrobiota bacterium]
MVVGDGSTDSTWKILCELKNKIAELAPAQNTGLHCFGRAIIWGLNQMKGDAVVIMMADESDDRHDLTGRRTALSLNSWRTSAAKRSAKR